MTTTSENELIRERVAIRCAKATMLLYSLASCRDSDIAGEKEERESRKREIEDLRRKLAMEKIRSNRIKLFGFMELFLLVLLLLLLFTFFLVFFLASPSSLAYN